jgi:hypothetical protein
MYLKPRKNLHMYMYTIGRAKTWHLRIHGTLKSGVFMPFLGCGGHIVIVFLYVIRHYVCKVILELCVEEILQIS